MEQFITGDIWEKVNLKLKKDERKTACIAYVTLDNLDLNEDDILVCNASLFSIKNGETCAKALESYFNKGVEIYSNQNLHSKILVTDSLLVVGSANLSKNSSERLIESSIITDNETLVAQANSFCYNVIKEDKSTLLSRQDIDSLLKIKVKKRSPQIPVDSTVRNKTFGDRTWILAVHDLSDKIAEEEKKYEEQAKRKLRKKEVSSIRITGNSKFRTSVLEGDQFFEIWKDKSSNKRLLYPLNTVLLVQRRESWTRIYYDRNKTEAKEIPISDFKNIKDRLKLDKKVSKSSLREISKSDVLKLETLF